MITLAEIISGALERREITQQELGERANLSQARISELANGRGLPRRRGIKDLAKALRYDPTALEKIVEADRKRGVGAA